MPVFYGFMPCTQGRLFSDYRMILNLFWHGEFLAISGGRSALAGGWRWLALDKPRLHPGQREAP